MAQQARPAEQEARDQAQVAFEQAVRAVQATDFDDTSSEETIP